MADDNLDQSGGSPRKRTLSSDTNVLLSGLVTVTGPGSPHSTDSPNTKHSTILPTGASREPSPALSITSSLTSISNILPPVGLDGTVQSALDTPGAPPAKRRKLTLAEKAQRQLEKAQKERQKSDQKAKKDEEKLLKDEERRQKAEVKEEKRREKELEKQQKEEERRRKEQEREDEKRRREEEEEKKKKAQSRIHNFFAKPTQPQQQQSPKPQLMPTRCLPNSQSPQSLPATVSDYEKTFLPFSPPSHSECAPILRFTWDDEAVLHLQTTFDSLVHNACDNMSRPSSVKDCLPLIPWNVSKRCQNKWSIKEIMSRLTEPNETSGNSINSFSSSELLFQLRNIPMKYIYFHQDVRPPFVGTYTKYASEQAGKRAARNPFLKVRTDTDYDYDSEAEWEEPEEGEELDSEGESDTESVDTTEDMAGFLDDEDSADGLVTKRRVITSDMEPISSGICWENERGALSDPDVHNLRSYRLVVIEDCHTMPIDPFSTAYWTERKGTKVSSTASVQMEEKPLSRPPLQQRQNLLNGVLGSQPSDGVQVKAKAPKVAGRLMKGADLELFKQIVKNSPHNKVGLLAILKKEKFPNYSNAMLKDTLDATAKRVGDKEMDKKWTIREDAPT